MKNLFKLFAIVTIVVFSVLITSCTKDEPSPQIKAPEIVKFEVVVVNGVAKISYEVKTFYGAKIKSVRIYGSVTKWFHEEKGSVTEKLLWITPYTIKLEARDDKNNSVKSGEIKFYKNGTVIYPNK